jgi:hypothetical protein
MLWILCILLGVTIGQHLKIALTPELRAFLTSSWRLANEKALPVANLAAKQIKSAVKTARVKSAQTDAEIRFMEAE